MEITLKKASFEDTNLIHQMQVQSFKPLLNKYQNFEMGPVGETLQNLGEKIGKDDTDLYIIKYGHVSIGALRVVKEEENACHISPIFILPEYQGKGIGQKVLKMVEKHYENATTWLLDTIKEEKINCYLYEKMGYKVLGEERTAQSEATLVHYAKHLEFK